MVDVIVNGDFEKGLSGWTVVSGTAFARQPVRADKIGAADVLIDGRHPVELGGDFWHTDAFPLGHDGRWLIRIVTAKASGVLDSTPFTITHRYLGYRLGGTAGGGCALEVRVPEATAKSVRRKALDGPDADGYVAVVAVTPRGSDVLQEDVIDLVGKVAARSLMGATAKVRLRVTATDASQRFLVDDLRLLDTPPPRRRRPLWGWADIHCHPMAQAGFGDLLAAHARPGGGCRFLPRDPRARARQSAAPARDRAGRRSPSDPSSGDLSPGADRHSAHCAILAAPPPR